MRSYQNPFAARVSEQSRDPGAFLRMFEPGALSLLPLEALWDRLLVLRSAPGFGKTSLMRVFTHESLKIVHSSDDPSLKSLAGELRELGALDDAGPRHLGVLIDLSTDYAALIDVGAPPDIADRLFFRLIDARIFFGFLRAALDLEGLRIPEDVDRLQLVLGDPAPDAEATLKTLGGGSGRALLDYCRRMEDENRALLNSLKPVDWASERGHASLYSLDLLSRCEVRIDGRLIERPLHVMFDDMHELHSGQRSALLKALIDRRLRVARWCSERYQALPQDELLTVDASARSGDFEELPLEVVARGEALPKGRRWRIQFEKLLTEIGDRRAAPALSRYAEILDDLSSLLDSPDPSSISVDPDVLKKILEEERMPIDRSKRYATFLEEAEQQPGIARAVALRALHIRILRHQNRAQPSLFEGLPAAEGELPNSSAIREAAEHAVYMKHGLPFYAGASRLAKLGSSNVEQYLQLCRALFEEMLGEITLRRHPQLSARRQDAIVRRVSAQFWKEIPSRVPFGREVQRFVEGVVGIARIENAKPSAPYLPGVTGIAMYMDDRDKLCDPAFRKRNPGAEALYSALSSAVAHNVITLEPDRESKRKRVMVIYLNRLLCPRFELPLGRGGFREQKLPLLLSWMI